MKLRSLIALLLAALAIPGTAVATYPGANGEIFYGGSDAIATPSLGEVMDGVDHGFNSQFSVSPDGTKLAFVRNNEIMVYTLGAAINSATNVTNNAADDFSVSFCGNNRLVFTSDRGGSDDLWIMGSSGSNPRQLTNTPGSLGNDYAPSCSRTGAVMFERLGLAPGFDPIGAGTHDTQIWTVSSCGGTPAELTFGSADSPSHFRRAVVPDVSPDGTKVAFAGTNVSENKSGVWIIAASGGAPTLLVDLGERPQDVVWSPDGTKIAYQLLGTGKVFTVNSAVPAGTPQELGLADFTSSSAPIAWGASVPNNTPPISDPVCSGTPPVVAGNPTPPGGGGGGGGGSEPSNAFKAGKATASATNGTVTLTVTLPGPGSLDALATAKVAKASASARKVKITVARKKVTARKAGKLKLTLKPKKKAKGALRAKGKLRATLKLTFTPKGGSPKSSTRSVTFKLKRRRR